MVKRRRPSQWHLGFTGIGLMAAVAVAIFVSHLPPRPPAVEPTRLHNLRPPTRAHADAGSFADGIVVGLDSVLSEIAIAPTWIERRPADGDIDTISVHVPGDLPVASVNRHLTEFVNWHGGHIVRGEQRQGPAAVDLTFGIDSTVTTFFRLRRDAGLQRRTGRIAIVVGIDGASESILQRLLQLSQPLTLATGGSAAKLVVAPGTHQVVADMPTVALQLDAHAVTSSDVSRSLWALAEQAADEGRAIAAAHLQPVTLVAFENSLPLLERRGYRFVTLAELDR